MIKQKTLLIILGTIILLLFGATYYASKIVQKIPKLDQTFLQIQLNTVLEKYGKGTKKGVDYELKDAEIKITDKVYLNFSLDTNIYGYTSDIIANTVGIPKYNKQKKYFYFLPSEQIDFEKLEIGGNFKPKGVVSKILSKTKFAEKLLSKDGLVGKVTADKKLMKEITEVAITKYLQNFPIYKLNNKSLPSAAIGLALDRVEVSNGEIQIYISFWQITKTVALYLFVLIAALGMTVALVLNPEMFGALLVLSAFSN